MASYDKGKAQMAELLRSRYPRGATVLDVGAGDGKLADLLGDYFTIDAVEIYAPYIVKYGLASKYRKVFNCDIVGRRYKHYDIVIFGDVIEHLTVADAKKVLDYAAKHSSMQVVAVPFLYEQGALNGNEHERHIQPDLTPAIFEERFGKREVLISFPDYCYYGSAV